MRAASVNMHKGLARQGGRQANALKSEQNFQRKPGWFRGAAGYTNDKYQEREDILVKKSTATAVATTCLGIAAAGTAYMLSGNNNMRRKTKTFRRNTEKALRQVGSFLENASDMMR